MASNGNRDKSKQKHNQIPNGGLEGDMILLGPKYPLTSSQGPSGDGKNHIQDNPAGQPGELHTDLSCLHPAVVSEQMTG